MSKDVVGEMGCIITRDSLAEAKDDFPGQQSEGLLCSGAYPSTVAYRDPGTRRPDIPLSHTKITTPEFLHTKPPAVPDSLDLVVRVNGGRLYNLYH